MRSIRLCAVAFILALAVLPAGATDTVEGEILDMACFIPRGAKGPSHARCAKSCADSGMPLGVLTDEEKIYLLYPKHGKEEAFETVKELAGQRAKLSGTAAERQGLLGFEVHEAAPAE